MTDSAIFTEMTRLVEEFLIKTPAIMTEAMMEATEKSGANPKLIAKMQEYFKEECTPPDYTIAEWLDVDLKKFQALARKAIVRIRDGLDDAEIETAQKDFEEWDKLRQQLEELKAKHRLPIVK